MAREVYYPVLSYAILRYSAVSSFKVYYNFILVVGAEWSPSLPVDSWIVEPSHDVEEA